MAFSRRVKLAVVLSAVVAIFVLASASAVPLDPSGDLDAANFNSPTGRNQHNYALVAQFGEARGAVLQPDGSLVIAANAAEGGSILHFCRCAAPPERHPGLLVRNAGEHADRDGHARPCRGCGPPG